MFPTLGDLSMMIQKWTQKCRKFSRGNLWVTDLWLRRWLWLPPRSAPTLSTTHPCTTNSNSQYVEENSPTDLGNFRRILCELGNSHTNNPPLGTSSRSKNSIYSRCLVWPFIYFWKPLLFVILANRSPHTLKCYQSHSGRPWLKSFGGACCRKIHNPTSQLTCN